MYWKHETAIIDEGAHIGSGTKLWHWTHVCGENVSIGENCSFGQNCYVGKNVTIGNNVRIQNNVSVYDCVELEDNVFCGPSMVFTNVINPRAQISRKQEYKKTLVKTGATIGANATIICGNIIGEFCFIGAGSVVTNSTKPYSLMIGVPATQAGWICECGVKLDGMGSKVSCSTCGKHYSICNDYCKPISAEVKS